jgi:hypothetical protein
VIGNILFFMVLVFKRIICKSNWPGERKIVALLTLRMLFLVFRLDSSTGVRSHAIKVVSSKS